jgi:hypothetical protein
MYLAGHLSGHVGVDTVVDGVSGVELDGGEGGLSGGGSGSGGHSGTGVDEGSVHGGGVSDLGDDGGGGGGGETSVSESKVAGVSESSKSESSKTESISEGNASGDDVTPLPLGSGFGGGGSFGDGGEVSGLSFGDLGGVYNGDGKGEVKDGSDEGLGNDGGGSDGKVGAGNAESVDGIGDVVDGLEETVAIEVLVGAGGHAIGVTGLATGRWTTSVSKGELTELILSVELVGRSGYWSIDPGMSEKLGASSGHAGCQYDLNGRFNLRRTCMLVSVILIKLLRGNLLDFLKIIKL